MTNIDLRAIGMTMNGDRKRPARQPLSRFSHADRAAWTIEAAGPPRPAQASPRVRGLEDRRLADMPARAVARPGIVPPSFVSPPAPQRGAPVPAGLAGIAPTDADRVTADTSAARETDDPVKDVAPAAAKRKRIGLRSAVNRAAMAVNAGAATQPRIGARAKSAIGTGLNALVRNTRKQDLKAHYKRALVALHRRVLDRQIEPLFFHPTIETGDPAAPAVLVSEGARFEGPIPVRVFDWLMSALPADLKDFAFVDFRAQRGRATLLAARRNFESITAYEYDAKRFDELQMNVAQFPRSLMACRKIDIIRGDRDGLSIPAQPAVLYFANADREPFLSLIMGQVAASYRLNPRRIYVILEHPAPNMPILQDSIFYRMKLAPRERMLMRLLSPLKAHIYRSLV
jgi:hypothetical protein